MSSPLFKNNNLSKFRLYDYLRLFCIFFPSSCACGSLFCLFFFFFFAPRQEFLSKPKRADQRESVVHHRTSRRQKRTHSSRPFKILYTRALTPTPTRAYVVYSDERNDRFSRIDGNDCGTGDVVAKTTNFVAASASLASSCSSSRPTTRRREEQNQRHISSNNETTTHSNTRRGDLLVTNAVAGPAPDFLVAKLDANEKMHKELMDKLADPVVQGDRRSFKRCPKLWGHCKMSCTHIRNTSSV